VPTVDTSSEPGAWEREWDSRVHTVSEYQREIRDMRDRIRTYLSEIARLRDELREEQSRNSEWVREP
jgi:predicted RNase H-like nuclease (RuvC/YqgF family)